MRFGIMLKQGDIVLIPIPFTDLSSNKKRPVLVLSKSEYNNKMNDIVGAAITSNLENKEYSVLITNSDLSEGELKVDSLIRADKIYTLSLDIIVKRFGTVKEKIVESRFTKPPLRQVQALALKGIANPRHVI
jgi:mRNA interferase MazF